MNRAFESEGGDFEFNPEMGEFGESEFGEAEFGEAEFGEAEFDEAELSMRDHRRRPSPWPATRSRACPQRPFPSRLARTPQPYRYPARPRYSSRPYAAPSYTAPRPYGASRPFQWRSQYG